MSHKSPDSPLASWTGKDLYRGQVVPTLTVILKTAGCSWNRCLMCSYRHERFGDASESESLVKRQLRWIVDNHSLDRVEMVKIFTSGSFFDPREVPKAAFEEAARTFSGKIVIAETRPEYVERERVSDFLSIVDTGAHETPLYVAMGLETTDDFIREKCIDKGFSYDDFRTAVKEASLGGAGTKAYLLMKPLFLTEREAIADMKSSISEIADKTEMISMNPCTVQRKTRLEWYWKQGAYRPPYLWSVLDVLRDAPVFVSCDPVGGGHARGPHNCGTCDFEIVKGIRDYSLSGDRALIDGLFNIRCDCKKEWEFVVSEEEPYSMPLSR